MLERDPNSDLNKHRATPVDAPVVVNGRLYFQGDSDFYSYEGKAGQKYHLELRPFMHAPAGQMPFQPYIALYNERREKLLESNPLTGGTGELEHVAGTDGNYLLEVRDALFRGGAGYVYRLRLE